MPEKRTEDIKHLNGEANIVSFILRVWLEETSFERRQTSWRGHITPVPNGKRHYFSDIKDIPDFIAAHLKAQR